MRSVRNSHFTCNLLHLHRFTCAWPQDQLQSGRGSTRVRPIRKVRCWGDWRGAAAENPESCWEGTRFEDLAKRALRTASDNDPWPPIRNRNCLLYTSDAADE